MYAETSEKDLANEGAPRKKRGRLTWNDEVTCTLRGEWRGIGEWRQLIRDGKSLCISKSYVIVYIVYTVVCIVYRLYRAENKIRQQNSPKELETLKELSLIHI